MNIRSININLLKPYEQNTKIHTPEQVDMIANSIQQFGFRQPIVIDKNNVVVVGHGRLKAAKKLGIAEIPCVVIDDLTEDEIKAYRIVDNKANESEWDFAMLDEELKDINYDMAEFGFDEFEDFGTDDYEEFEEPEDERSASFRHNVFENQELVQFPITNKYGFPDMKPTYTTGNKFIRFCDWKETDERPEEYIAHFFYDDYKFMSAWREPNKYVDRLRQFKAVISPDFSLYTDFPMALQILSCYRRQWCGAYWQSLGIDVIPDVIWGEPETFEWCFDGIPKGGTVALSSVGVKRDKEWNSKEGSLFKQGYDEMLKRLEPETILYYGDMIDGLEGNIIRIPSFYEQKREMLNEMSRLRKEQDGQRKK